MLIFEKRHDYLKKTLQEIENKFPHLLSKTNLSKLALKSTNHEPSNMFGIVVAFAILDSSKKDYEWHLYTPHSKKAADLENLHKKPFAALGQEYCNVILEQEKQQKSANKKQRANIKSLHWVMTLPRKENFLGYSAVEKPGNFMLRLLKIDGASTRTNGNLNITYSSIPIFSYIHENYISFQPQKHSFGGFNNVSFNNQTKKTRFPPYIMPIHFGVDGTLEPYYLCINTKLKENPNQSHKELEDFWKMFTEVEEYLKNWNNKIKNPQSCSLTKNIYEELIEEVHQIYFNNT